MKNLIKQTLVTVFIISYIVLLVLYTKTDAEFKMYKTFTEKGIKIHTDVPCTLPPLN